MLPSAALSRHLRAVAPRAFFATALLLVGLASTGGPLPGHEPERAQAATNIALQLVVPNLTRPTAITHPPDNTNRLFITQQDGQILVYDGTPTLTTFLDISSIVACCGEEGLLSVAFHPNYASNGYFYVYYANNSNDITIARYHASPASNVADATPGTPLLTIPHPNFSNHYGGQLQFGPDGKLYAGIGDGGSQGDPNGNGQNLGTLLAKILRLDVDIPAPYIPANNPFVGDPNARHEIWARGVRNPWRFSFDRLTGDLLIGDVGGASYEEVDFQQAASSGGQNYGWSIMEGMHCTTAGCDQTGLTLPVLEYTHANGNCSITGGYRYRGAQNAALYGTYLYGDFCSGRIWGATNSGNTWITTELKDTALEISTFGEDRDGEIYVADRPDVGAGAIYRIGVDTDADNVIDVSDNCPTVANATQTDGDADLLGDACEASVYGTSATNPDSDDDGCRDGREARTLTFPHTSGGDRSATSPWDFFDVPTPALSPSATTGTKNQIITLSDVLAILYYTGTTDSGAPNVNGVDYDTDFNANGVKDGREYDRMPSADPQKLWRSQAPSGAVSLQDALVALAQVADSCRPPP